MCITENGVSIMRYIDIKGLDGTEIPKKEELIYLLRSHDLFHRRDMGTEELWNIFTQYFNARDEFISIIRDSSKDERKQELIKCMNRLKNK
jgi:hypothetical protein